MKNRLIVGLLLVAFFIGTVSSSLIVMANADSLDPYSTIVQAIHNITMAIRFDNYPVSLSITGSNTGNFTTPFDTDKNAFLYYGTNLCRIDAYSNPFLGSQAPATILIKFGESTLVQNQAAKCGDNNTAGNIVLAGVSDHTFGKGSKLILGHNSDLNPIVWTEIAREPQ